MDKLLLCLCGISFVSFSQLLLVSLTASLCSLKKIVSWFVHSGQSITNWVDVDVSEAIVDCR